MDKLISASNAAKIAQEYYENLAARRDRFVEEHLIEPVSKEIYAVASEGGNEFLFRHKIQDKAINSFNLVAQIVRRLCGELEKHDYKVSRVSYDGYYKNYTIAMRIAWD